MSHLDLLMSAVEERADDYTWPLGLLEKASEELQRLRLDVLVKQDAICDLRERLDSWQDSALAAERESCGDEKHCTCVGVLRHTIEELRAQLEAKEKP